MSKPSSFACPRPCSVEATTSEGRIWHADDHCHARNVAPACPVCSGSRLIPRGLPGPGHCRQGPGTSSHPRGLLGMSISCPGREPGPAGAVLPLRKLSAQQDGSCWRGAWVQKPSGSTDTKAPASSTATTVPESISVCVGHSAVSTHPVNWGRTQDAAGSTTLRPAAAWLFANTLKGCKQTSKCY